MAREGTDKIPSEIGAQKDAQEGEHEREAREFRKLENFMKELKDSFHLTPFAIAEEVINTSPGGTKLNWAQGTGSFDLEVRGQEMTIIQNKKVKKTAG